VRPDVLTPESALSDYADSLDFVEIVMRIEDAFLIDITDREAEHLKTVQDLASLVSKKTETQTS
jgi:acyl carrier protein